MYIKKILLALSIIVALFLAYLSYNVYQAVFEPNTSFKDNQQELFISKKDNIDSVLNKISPYLKETENFIEVANRKQYQPKAGHFILNKGMNNNEIVNVLRSQNTPVNITFNNAESIRELSGMLAKQFDDDSLSFLNVFQDKSFLIDKGVDLQQSLAFYIPNTYEFYWNTSPEDVRKRLLKQYEAFWNDEREMKRKSLNLTRVEVSVLASIVQKESAKVDERPRIAGVYINRLKRDMKLQADPTVIYALKQKYNSPDTIIRRVLNKDLKVDSPFNTYKYYGLPPAPLIMPDVSSLDAVLNYENHDFLYFVADIDKPGYHSFSKTLREHNRNARIYRRWINEQKIYR
jgi:UPF0755 protein